MVVWKFKVESIVPMPKGGHVLHVDVQSGVLTLWAAVDPSAPCEDRHFAAVMTGEEWTFPKEHMRHIGTVMVGPMVYHIFEVMPELT